MEEGEGEKEELGWRGRRKRRERTNKKITKLIHEEMKMSMRKSHIGIKQSYFFV